MTGAASAALALLAAGLGAAVGPLLVEVAQRTLREPVRIGRSARGAAAVVTGALFTVVVLRLGLDPAVLGYLVFVTAAVPLSIVDLAEKRLPDALVLPAAATVAALLVAADLLHGRPGAVAGVLLGAVGLFAVYLTLAVVSRGQLGMGDVKLGLVAGAATGYLGLQPWLVGLLAGVLLNGLAAAAALALRRTTRRGSVPFGPSILGGALIAVVLFA